MELVKRLFVEEEGQDLAEYGMLLALIALVAVIAVTTLGQNIQTTFTDVAAKVLSPGG